MACVASAFVLCHAQADRKNELGLLLGATVTPELRTLTLTPDRLQVGAGITFQLAYARQLRSSRSFGVYFEVPALAVPLQHITSSNGAIPSNYDSFFVTPGVRVRLRPGSHISPWLSTGGGYALFDESAKRIDGSHNTTRGTSGAAVQFGAGVDVRSPIKVLFPIGFRLEVRDLYTSKPTYNVSTGGGFQHNLVFSGGPVLHF